MKRTIATSFLFLLPINLCFMYGELFHLNLSVISFGLSMANHSHNFFTHDIQRKNIIRFLDQYVNGFNLIYTYYSALTNMNCIVFGTTNLVIVSTIYLCFLLPTQTEKYNEKQKTLHALWHFLGICGMTYYKWACLYG